MKYLLILAMSLILQGSAFGQVTEKIKILPAVFQSGTLTNGLVSYWRLDEASGTRYDSYGTNHLTVVGGVGSTAGKIGLGATNSGSGRLTTTNYLATVSNQMSLSVWLKTSFVAGKSIYGYGNNSVNGSRFNLYMFSSGGTNSLIAEGCNVYLATRFPTASSFVHIVATISNSFAECKIYTNGVECIPFLLVDSVFNSFNTNSRVSMWAVPSTIQENPNTGSLDETALWSRVLTSNEISRLYNAGAALKFPRKNTAPWK